nr:hypothetical protein [uncultured Rhodopila sp.]
MTAPGAKRPDFRRREVLKALTLSLAASLPRSARAASLSAKGLKVLGSALSCLQPEPSGQLAIAVAYVAGDEASRKDAEALAALMGEGVHAGRAVFQPRLVDTASLGGGGYAAILAASGADGERLMAASRAARVLCVTADFAAVQAGRCVMAIRAEPRVEVLVNHAAAAAAGVELAPAFLMMIREI